MIETPEAESTPALPLDAGLLDDEPIFDRPVIRVTSELHTTITAACQAIAGDLNIFARDGQLVDVVHSAESETDSYVSVGAPKIRSIALATMRERLTRAAVFERGKRGDVDDPSPLHSIHIGKREVGKFDRHFEVEPHDPAPILDLAVGV